MVFSVKEYLWIKKQNVEKDDWELNFICIFIIIKKL